MYKNKNRSIMIWKRILISLFAIILIFICVSPIFFIVWNAPKSLEEYDKSKFSPPSDFRNLFNNIKELIDVGFLRWLLNTAIVTLISIILSLVFTTSAGFAFSKLNFPGRTMMYWSIIGLLAMPTQVIIVPLFVIFSNLNMINNVFTMSLIYTVFSFAFGTFLMTSFYKGIPDEIIDSAKIDGANTFMIFIKIMVPLGKPAIVTLGVLNFFNFWNELFVAMIFNQNKASRLVTPGLSLFQQAARAGGSATNWTMIYTGILLSIIIPLIVYFIFQNRLSSGITVGAVKG